MAEEQQEEKPAKGGSKLTLILVAVVAIALGAGGTFAVTAFMAGEPEAAAADPEAEADAEADAVEEPFEQRVVALDPFVVNLGGSGSPRYLKLTLSLEARRSAEVPGIEAQVPKLRDAVIVLLSSRRIQDLEDFEGKALMKEEVLERINGALGEPLVQSVLFSELVVQ